MSIIPTIKWRYQKTTPKSGCVNDYPIFSTMGGIGINQPQASHWASYEAETLQRFYYTIKTAPVENGAVYSLYHTWW